MAVVGELYLGALDTGVWMQIAFLCVLTDECFDMFCCDICVGLLDSLQSFFFFLSFYFYHCTVEWNTVDITADS